MMTKDEAKRASETELRSRKLARPMTLEELNVFCEEMYKRLEFKSHSERLADILKWAGAGNPKTCPARPTETYSASDLRRDATRNQSMCTRSRFECLGSCPSGLYLSAFMRATLPPSKGRSTSAI